MRVSIASILARMQRAAARIKRPGARRNSSHPATNVIALILAVLLFSMYGIYYAVGFVGATGSPITATMPASTVACSPRFSSEDVWPGYFYEQAPPPGGPTLTQRIDALGLDYWRVQAVSGYNDTSNSKPFPVAYTGTDGHSVSAWNFATLDKVLSDGPATATRLLDITAPPESMFTGTGKLPGDNTSQGTLSDPTYAALAQYYGDIVRYFRTGVLQSGSGATVTYTNTTLTDTAKDFSAYGGGGYSVTATALDANGFPDWMIGTITSVTNAGHTVNVSSWSKAKSVGSISATAPANGAAYNLAATTPPITNPVSASPWPRPPSVGNVQYYEIFNESDLSNSFFPRTSPAVLPPTPALTGVNVSGGTLTPGITYAYRITGANIGTTESNAGTEVFITLPAGMNSVKIDWSATSNLGLSPFAYRIYGRSTGNEKAMVVVGRDASTGLTWTDKGSVTPSGAFPTVNNTQEFQLWRAREYTKMWNVVVPALKTVDSTIEAVGPVISNPQSLAVLSTNTTVVTTGPNDNSWKDNTDFIPFLMANGSPKPDVVSYHGYGGWQGSVSTDTGYFSGLQTSINDYKSLDEAAVGSTPVWNTESNIDAGFLDNNDYRALTQLGSAWLAHEAVQYCQQAPSVQQLFQFEVANTNTWNLFNGVNAPANCYPQPSCLNIKAQEPNLEYWMIYWVSRYFPAGTKVVPVSNIPAGYSALATQAPGSTQVNMLVVNTQTNNASPGTGVAGSVSVQLAGANSTDTKQVMIDGSTNITNGPTVTDLGPQSTVTLNLAGYGVALLSFDTGGTPADVAPSVPANLHSTSTTSSSISLGWSAATDSDGTGVAGYKLYRNGILLTTLPGGTSLNYNDTGLSANTTYSYAVSAYDTAGNEGTQTNSVSVSTGTGASPSSLGGDCNGDGHVTIIDLSVLLSHYGVAYPACDFHNDGYVSIIDLSILLSNYGS
jgi:hypothetical protein